MKNIIAVALIILTPSSVSAQQQKHRVFYVSDHGNDQSAGTSAATAFKTLERGRNAARTFGPGAKVLIAGHFVRSSPLQLTLADKGLTFAAALGTKAVLIADRGARVAIAIDGADGVQIRGLYISGFASDGLFARDALNVRIVQNTITNTRSTAWSQGAIHLTGNVRGALVQDNVVQGADYAGIIVDSEVKSNASNAKIKGNVVNDTCRRIADCGAIYINDRGRRSTGIIIAQNDIDGFGPPSSAGRAIYLDDWASGAWVHSNSIKGPGVFAFQIHGGHDNRIESNRVDLRKINDLILVQPAAGGSWADLSGNIVADNAIEIMPGVQTPPLARQQIPKQAQPKAERNQACVNRQACVMLR